VEDALRAVDGVETVQLSIGGGLSLAAAFGAGGGITFSVTTSSDADQTDLQAEIRYVLDGLTGVGEVSLASAGSAFSSSDIDINITAINENDLRRGAQAVYDAV